MVMSAFPGAALWPPISDGVIEQDYYYRRVTGGDAGIKNCSPRPLR